jgi:signal transduction histidine kinase
MWETLEQLFGDQFMPHGHCYLWSPSMVWLQVSANLAIGGAYVAISATLYYIIRRIRNVPFSWMFTAFGVFIITCGATHFMDAVTIWHPIYWFDGGLRAITAVASVGTAILLVPLVPKAVALANASRLAQERGQRLEQMYLELQEAHHKAGVLERAKTDFYANVSHELRTPLTLILGPVEQLAADPSLSDEQRARATVAARNATILRGHVNELLDIAQIDAGKLAPRYARTDLAQIVRIAGSLFEGAAHDGGFALETVTPSELRATLDSDMVGRVLQNLLANAAKHVGSGGLVRCVLERVDGMARIDVEDSGPGIPMALRDAVFERFRQIGTTESRVGGSGLGLAIVKELVELQGGTVRIEDAPTGGARFRVELPLRTASAGPPAPADAAPQTRSAGSSRPPAPPEPNPRDPSRAAVLVVEDNADMRWFLRDTLAPHYHVELAADGQDGFERARTVCPDLMITDVTMPRMGGEAFLAAVRGEPSLTHTPVIVLSARAEEAVCVKLLRQGANDYAVKPFSADELLARVANLVALKRVRDVLASELHAVSGSVETMALELAAQNRALGIANRDLALAKERAEDASAAREKFMNLVSHEIRTPLTSLHLQLALLYRSGLEISPKQRSYFEKMESLFGHLSEMMSALLEYANLQSGDFVPTEEVVNVGALTEQVVAPFARRAADKGLAMSVDVQPALPNVKADAHLTSVLLTQLVSNAVRHTRQGSVAVRVRAHDHDIRIDVVDTGPGISAERREHLFRPFEPLEDTAYKHTPGLGIGLALAKRIAAATHARLEVISQAGAGSTFTAVLPMLGGVS